MPVPFKLGWEKLPGVFKKSGATNERAMEALKNAGIIKLTGYSNAQSSCREYAVSQRFLRKLFGNDREAYLSRKDRYHYLSDIFTKRKSYSFDEMIGVAIDRGQNAKHQQSKRDIPNDIKGCQLEILRHELLSIGIPAKSLEMLETQYICRVLRIAEELVKQFRFSSVFNAGFVTLSLKSSTRRLLNRELGKAEAKRVLKRWKHLLKPLRRDLALLLDHYEGTAKTNRYGKCVTNAVGQSFNITYKDVAARKRRKSDVMRRKLLSHMLQGLESRAVYDYVTGHKGVCALEHDGFVSYEEVTDWSHPYLLIEKKH